MFLLKPRVGDRIFVGDRCVVVADGANARGLTLRVWDGGACTVHVLARRQWAPVPGGRVQYQQGGLAGGVVRLCFDATGTPVRHDRGHLCPEFCARVAAASGLG